MNQRQQPAIVFDAFGTLYDVSALGELMGEHISNPEQVSTTWRETQLRYTFIRTMTHAYADFDQVTREALDRALSIHGVKASAATRERLTQLWTELPLYSDATQMLVELSGYTRMILSNGTFETLSSLIRSSGIDQEIDLMLSADSVARFKPDAMVYEMAAASLEVPRNAVHFITSNSFDVAGAKAAGFTVYWVNRTQLPLDTVGWEPDVTVSNLAELPKRIG